MSLKMVEIDEALCIGCGHCADDCVAQNILIEDEKAYIKKVCFCCGHCVAICPAAAVSIPAYDMEDVEDLASSTSALDAQTLLRAIKSRRSIRNYKPASVEAEKINAILEAGRYTATAKNTQGCRFVIVQQELGELKNHVWTGISDLLALPLAEKPRWVKLYKMFWKSWQAGGEDFLFRNAPAVVFIATDRADDAGLAAQNMELMAASLGLGVLYNGYLCRAVDELPSAKEWLGVGDKTLQICMLLGYPATSYRRTAPRRAGDFVVK